MIELLLASERAEAVERSVEGVDLVAPDSLNLEVLQAIRGLERSGRLTRGQAEGMLVGLLLMSVTRVPTFGLIVGAWALRHNLTAYDAGCIALARRLGAPLITGDHRIARAPHLGIPLILV